MRGNCWNIYNGNRTKVYEEVKKALGDRFNSSVFNTLVGGFKNKPYTSRDILELWPQESAPQEKIFRHSDRAAQEGDEKTVIYQYPVEWTREEIAKPENQDKLFIFTDNTDRSSGREPVNPESRYAQKYGKTADGKIKSLFYPKHWTSAVIRGLDNALPISTQRWYHGQFKREKGRWTNADEEEFKKVIKEEIDAIIDEWNTGKYSYIVLPKDGILAETGITDLNGKDRTAIKTALVNEMKRLYEAVGMSYSSEAAKIEKTAEQEKEEIKSAARKKSRQEKAQALKWDRYAAEGQGIEVSRASSDSFARQFAPEVAVFKEGTVIKIVKKSGRKKDEYSFNVGGYSIEAAFQMIKGYEKNPKGVLVGEDGKMLVKLNGRNTDGSQAAPKSEVLKVTLFRGNKAEREAAEEFVFNTAYLPLYREWMKQNEELAKELKSRVKTQGKILTDRYAGTRISSARALAEVMFGVPRTSVSERTQTKYDIQTKNAQRAVQHINRAIKASNSNVGIEILDRRKNSDQHIANLINDVNDKGQQTVANKYILSFSLASEAMRLGMDLFVNPFESVTNPQQAANMFIRWIIPNDPNSLPANLRVKLNERNSIRSMLAKGWYKKQTIVSDGSQRNIIYARTLRYIIDNFEELRQRYNPENIQDFGLSKHNIRVVSTSSTEVTDSTTMRFAPNEAYPEGVELDNSNSFKLEGIEGKERFTLTFPNNFNSLTNVQKERLFKTLAMAVPEGYTIVIDNAVTTKEQLDFFNKMTELGFTRVGDSDVTLDDGSTKNAGIFKRNGYVKERVVFEEPYSILNIEKVMKPGHTYMVEATSVDLDRNTNPNIIVIPTMIDFHKKRQSYYKDTDFDIFKRDIDKAVQRAKESIDKGFTVVLPKTGMGNGYAALQKWAPKLYQYLNEKLEEVRLYGNREAMANIYFSSPTVTVEAVDSPKVEDIALDPASLQSPRALLRQMFSDSEIHDFARFIGREFNRFVELETKTLIEETKQKIAVEKKTRKLLQLQKKLDRLNDQKKSAVTTLNERGVAYINDKVKNYMLHLARPVEVSIPDSFKQKYVDASKKDIFELLFQYAVPFIEDGSGIRINVTEMSIDTTEDIADKETGAEDTEGENTPEMIWQFNHRLVDPYKSLSKNVKRILSSIPMRDVNDLRKKQYDSIGQVKYCDSKYIYHSIMSRMAKMSLGEINNFMTVIPYSQLSDRQKKIYPLGMPVFPVLEGMKTTYPWANDLIKELQKSYNKNTAIIGEKNTSSEDIARDPVKIANIGNVASQFYANFQQQFVLYCTMVNNSIYEENRPSGSASLKQTAINNYQGNVRFKGVPMIYTATGGVDAEGIEAVLAAAKEFSTKVSSKGFWDEIKALKKKYEGESYEDMYEDASPALKDILKLGAKAINGCGIPIGDYNLFLVALQPEKKYAGIGEISTELITALEATKALPEGEHIFESSFSLGSAKGYAGKNYEKTSFYWNNFFRKFGDYVTEQEYEDSFRVLGKSRYSYTAPSYMSTTMLNLTNPDPNVRRRYIEDNFMPYDWFYDKEKKEFRNKMLEALYHEKASVNTEGTTNGQYGSGHDMLCKKDGNREKEYADWSPQDIYELMFKEYSYPSNSESGDFIIPVLSDSRICKAIQAKKLGISESLSVMASVVRQELGRMDLVEKRNIIFTMQNIQERMDSNQGISHDERKYYDANLKFYTEYRRSHPEKLQEVENFDANGSKFCFFPELNKATVSLAKAISSNNEFLQKLIQLLSSNPNRPSNSAVDFKKVLQTLQNMSEDTFNKKAATVGLTKRRYGNHTENGQKVFGEYYSTATKDEAIDQLIFSVLEEEMNKKVMNFFYIYTPYRDYKGKTNEAVLNGIIKNDTELAAEYNKIAPETKEAPRTVEDNQREADFYAKAYMRAKEFYYAHTATMSQFLQLMVTDIAYYVDPTTFAGSVDFAKRFKQVYGAGMKMNTNSKFGKKIERNIIIKDKVRRSSSYDVLEGVLDAAVNDGRILPEEKDSILYKMSKIKGTDGQAFRSLTSWRDIMDMVGRSSEEVFAAIENLREGTWTMKDFYVVFNTLKPLSFGPEDQDSGIGDIRMRTMVQHKNSEAVLLALYDTLTGSAKGDANYSHTLRGINRAMEEIYLNDEQGRPMYYANGERMRAIDVAQYHSAVKVGAHGIIDLNYSREKLTAAQESGKIEGFSNKEFEEWFNKKENRHSSYYDIEKKVGSMLDAGKISFQEYEKAMDYFEPEEDEIFEIIKSAIYKNGDESLGYDDQFLHKLPYANYCIQQPTDDHYTDENSGTFGSQPRHIIMADLPDDFSITINGKTYNREGIRERYNSLIVANLLDCYEKQIEPLFKDTGTIEDKKKKTALERLRDRLLPIIDSNPKYGKQMKDALEIVVDKDGHQTFALPLNNLTITQQLEEIFSSLFKNAIHNQTIAGGNVIITADVGYSKKLKVRGGKRDADGKLISAEGIEGIECLLPAHFKSKFEPYLETRIGKDGKEYQILNVERLKEDGLDKLIGYRIPTEGPYSIMPLIVTGFLPQQSGSSIVVAQEIVEISGSDNDVDKLYLMMKMIDGEGDVIKSSNEGHVLELSKYQRDNEIVDIFFGILTHPKMTHLWAHPGNFDTLTATAKGLQILKNRRLLNEFIKRAGLKEPVSIDSNEKTVDEQLAIIFTKDLSQKQLNTLYRKVMEIPESEPLKKNMTMLDIVESFADTFSEPLSPVYPDTYVAMHQSYMAGVAEKGIFANNTLDHAKLQWANVRILPAYTFSFNGRRVEKVDERYIEASKNGRKYLHYISSDCAECGAAAVDNGKKPVLDKLNCTRQTATFYGYLLRLGLGIRGAGLLLAQPAVDSSIRTSGAINPFIIKDALKKIAKRLDDLGEDITSDRYNWRLHNFTDYELCLNILDGNIDNLISKGRGDKTTERLASLYRTYSLILNLRELNSDMQEPRTVIHYDSPTHAADISMGGVIEQTKAVESLNDRENMPEFDRKLSGEDQLVVYDIEKKAASKNSGKSTYKLSELSQEERRKFIGKYRLFDALMNAELPITQAFYTLGIEKIRSELAPHFAFGRPEIQRLTDRLYNYMRNIGIYRAEDRRKIITQMYRDWVVYTLSKTKLFGDDEVMTFDQKRQYYLYDFPKKFLDIKGEVTEVNMIDAIRRMSVRKGQIIMDRGGKTTTTLRDFITDSFDELIQSPDPEFQNLAKMLFMYTYYLNGFEFSYMSFGNMLGTEFQRAFPEYIKALSDMNTDNIDNSDLDNFFQQFIIKRNNMGLVEPITFKNNLARQEALQSQIYNTQTPLEEYGSWADVPEFTIISTTAGRETYSTLLQLSKELSDLYKTIVYLPVKTNTALHFNANQTVDELLNVVYDPEKIAASRRIGNKKRSTYATGYDAYQSTRNQQDIPYEKNGNVPEAYNGENIDDGRADMADRLGNDNTNKYQGAEKRITGDESEVSVEMKAVGNKVAGVEIEVKPVWEGFDVSRIKGEESETDKYIKEAQKIVGESNDGNGVCFKL